MMKSTRRIVFLLCIMCNITGCDKEVKNSIGNGDSVKAIGTYRDSVDKDEWGDFQLVLEMEKSLYTLNEPILTKLYFLNIT